MTASKNSEFHQFEHRGWQKVAGHYHDFFASLTTQAVEPLLDAVLENRSVGIRLLDVATGPGYVAGAAADRGVRVTGVDFAPPMIAIARTRCPSVRFCVGDAQQLPFGSESFDAVVTNFGLLHLGRPDDALAEAHRVLRPGGRVGFTVWTNPQEAVTFGIVLQAIEAHGNLNVSIPPGPPFFRFSDPEECRRTLVKIGFEPPQVSSVPQVWRLRSPAELMEAMETGSVRTGALLLAQSSAALEKIRKEIQTAASAYEVNGYI